MKLKLRKRTVKCLLRSEHSTLCCCRRMEKISWTDRVRSVEVLHRVKKDRNVLRRIKSREAIWISHTLHRNCLLKHCWRKDVTERQGKRRKQLLDDLEETRRNRKLNGSHRLKHSLLKRLWTCRKTDEVMNEWMNEWIPVTYNTDGTAQNAFSCHILVRSSFRSVYFCSSSVVVL